LGSVALSLWSGMRLNECCQLMIDDVRYVREIPIIVIAEDPQGEGDEGDAKRVKTEAPCILNWSASASCATGRQ